jgi:glc operon protein GlcG
MLNRLTLDSSEVEAILGAAVAEATNNGWRVSIALVDEGGHLLAFRRLPGATASTAQIAIDKARSAALTQRPTQFFAELLSAGQLGASSLAHVIPMGGGLPLLHAEQCLGGIAASGVKSALDEQVAAAGVVALKNALSNG